MATIPEKDDAMFLPESKAVFDMTPRERAAQIAATTMNEYITRKRVDRMEGFLEALAARGLWGRVKLLLTGK